VDLRGGGRYSLSKPGVRELIATDYFNREKGKKGLQGGIGGEKRTKPSAQPKEKLI